MIDPPSPPPHVAECSQITMVETLEERILELQREVHYWRKLVTPVRVELQLLLRKRGDLSDQLAPLIARLLLADAETGGVRDESTRTDG